MTKLNKVYDIQTPSTKILAVAIKPDGTLCAAGDREGLTHIIDMSSGEIVRKLKQHIEFVYAIAFEPMFEHLITTGKDKSVREWDVTTAGFVRDHAGIFASATPHTLGAQSFKPNTKTHSKTITSVQCAMNGETRLMVTGGQDGLVKYWLNGEPIRSFSWHEGPVSCVRFQPGTNVPFSSSKDRTIRSWNVNNGAMIHKYQGHYDEVIGIDFIDQDHFISADASGTVRVWNVDKEQSLGELFYAPGQVRCMAVDSAHHLLLLGLNDGRLIGVNTQYDTKPEPQSALFTLDDHALAIRCIHVLGDKVATSDESGKVKIWNIEE